MTNEGAESANSAGAGRYVYADFGELDDIIGRWQTQGDDVRIDADLLSDANSWFGWASADAVTAEYASALGATFHELYRHTNDMSQYIGKYAARLAESRSLMKAVEEGTTAMFPGEGGN